MKKNRLLSFFGFLIGLLIFTSCENLDDLSNLGLRPNILAPALKTEIDVYDFDKLLNQNSTYIISFSEISNAFSLPVSPGTSIPYTPEITFAAPTPSKYLSIFNIAERIFLDTVNVTLSFKNTLPVSILPDTRFVLRDSANPSKVLFSHQIPTGTKVLPGEDYLFNFISSKDVITSTLEFFVQDLHLEEGNNVTFSGDDFIINLNVKIITIDKAELKNNVSYKDTTVSKFEINIPNPGDTSAYSGSFSIFLTNKYPAGFDLTLELLDENENFIFSVFGDSSLFLEHAPLDAMGNVVGEKTTKKLNFLRIEDIRNINRVKKMRILVELLTPPTPQTVIINNVTTIDMLITADIKIDPTNAQ